VATPLRPMRQGRDASLPKQVCGLIAAVAIPWFAMQLTMHLPELHSTPLLLGFTAVVLFTLMVSLPTGLTACASTALAFNYFVLAPTEMWNQSRLDIMHTLAVFIAAVLVSLLSHRQTVIRKRLHRALEAQRAHADALMDAQRGSNSVAWRLDATDRRFRWAEGGTAIFGRPFAEIADAATPVGLIVREDQASFEEALEKALCRGETFRVEFRVRWPNNELRWIEARGAATPGNAVVWRGVMVDVTERKNAELALIRSEKLAAIGRLSSTVAHEINNPLEAVTNLIYLAALDQHLQPETRNYLTQADSELARLAGIARHTLDFARQSADTGPVDLTQVAENVVVFFQSRCRSQASEIRIAGPANPLTVAAPTDELRQIVTNLVSNACDALPQAGGVVEVELSAQGRSAVLEIRDNGSGIAPEHRARVFEPFFTTKADVGTGIGLTVARELVERNGGTISVYSSGPASIFRTTFRLELPRAQTGA
jgi:PAS domain S-box-containing protein